MMDRLDGKDRIRAVICDLDETLIGPRVAQWGRLAALLHASLPAPAGGATRPLPSPVTAILTRLYAWSRRKVVLDAEVMDALEALRRAGLRVGLVTNGAARKRHTIELLGLGRWVSCVVVSEEEGRRKPDAALFQLAAERLGMRPGEILFVGDKPRQDIKGARSAGLRTAWLRRRPRWLPGPRRPPADLVVTSLRDVLAALGL